MATEWEIKMTVPGEQAAERLKADPEVFVLGDAPPSILTMTARYYDTPDNRLDGRRWSLRLRGENERRVVALKIPSEARDGVYSRDEYEVEAMDLDTLNDGVRCAEVVLSALPGLVAVGAPEKILDILDSEFLEERCRIEFVRHVFPLSWLDGTRAFLAVDQGMIWAGHKSKPFLEAELELVFGLPDRLIAMAERLRREYGLEPGLLSKYEQALRMLRTR